MSSRPLSLHPASKRGGAALCAPPPRGAFPVRWPEQRLGSTRTRHLSVLESFSDAAQAILARGMRPKGVVERRPMVLVCDDDRIHAELLARGLRELDHVVDIVRSSADAFAVACAQEVDAMLVAPVLRDGAALALPSTLGVRRPSLVILTTRIGERLGLPLVKEIGFDLQLAKVVDPRVADMLIRRSVEAALLRRALSRRGHGPRSAR